MRGMKDPRLVVADNASLARVHTRIPTDACTMLLSFFLFWAVLPEEVPHDVGCCACCRVKILCLASQPLDIFLHGVIAAVYCCRWC